MSIFAQFEIDSVKQEKGTPLQFSPNKDGSIPTFYVARYSIANPEYTKAFEEETEAVKSEMRLNLLPEEKAKALMIRVFCRVALKGWTNIQNRKGETIEYTLDAACDLMAKLPELYARIKVFAETMENFLLQDTEEAAKN